MSQRSRRSEALSALMALGARIPYWRPLVSDVAIVFMLHRFADTELGVDGTTSADLRANLAFLRRHRFRLASFTDVLDDDRDIADPHRMASPPVIFTVDDGYADFARVAAPLFAEFDCPVTVFLTTGPVDYQSWFWWDRVEHALMLTQSHSVELELDGKKLTHEWTDAARQRAVCDDIIERLKRVRNEEKEVALKVLAERLDVDMPSKPPARYAAMTWSDVRRCGALGVTFGPHTVTHPMLPQVGDEESEFEVLESWRRLRAECDATIPVFSYPNGAYTTREVRILSRTNLTAAVTTKQRYAAPHWLDLRKESRFDVPRFNYSGDRKEFISIVTGLDRLKTALREGPPGWRVAGA